MEIVVTNNLIEQFSNVLATLGKSTDPNIVFFVAMNVQKIQPILTALAKTRAAVQSFSVEEQQFSAACRELQLRCSEDSEGNAQFTEIQTPQGPSRRYEIRDAVMYETGMLELKTRFSAAVALQEEKADKVESLLKKTVTLDLETLRFSECPDGLIDGNSAALLLHMGVLEFDVSSKAKSLPMCDVPVGLNEVKEE